MFEFRRRHQQQNYRNEPNATSDRTQHQTLTEAPPPRHVISERAANERSDDGAESKDGAVDALVLAAVAERDDVGDNDL
ncbi:hypothetical protein BC938DRAFT_471376 [Jimgerdemannia flammicorona]|uniref:Uncharacterized protein n=1 Tax=Jimgerdemannia flammicorona TaxID=994334 RepID=A0A433Q8B3_9FUNG|nr:hypothetical protein BC938DRAFT_471376 [Jimgerdemannia flammicorona]